MNEVRLRRLIEAAVALTLAGCAQRIDPATFAVNVCRDGVYTPLANITPATPVDFVALRDQVDQNVGFPPGMDFETVASTGASCSTATDPVACTTALAALRSAEGWKPNVPFARRWETHRYVVTTRGDTIATITTLDALADFLGPLATEDEAAWFASERGYRISCDGPNARRTPTGFELRVQSGSDCGGDVGAVGVDEHVLAVDQSGRVTVRETVRVRDAYPNCISGRRPSGMALGGASPTAHVGDYLARAAELEAASVHAFRRLACELRALGAPERLALAAERSMRDEVRHARVMSRLAQRHGGTVRSLRPPPSQPRRSAYAIAHENAVEGCVRETFGALQATYQSAHARDPELARALGAIARDETRHAALAWDVAAWLEPRLTDRQRASLAGARRRAVATLRRELSAAAPRDAVALAGVPDVGAARSLLTSVAGELWA